MTHLKASVSMLAVLVLGLVLFKAIATPQTTLADSSAGCYTSDHTPSNAPCSPSSQTDVNGNPLSPSGCYIATGTAGDTDNYTPVLCSDLTTLAGAGGGAASPCQSGENFLGVLVPWYAYFDKSDFNPTTCTLDLNFVNKTDGSVNTSNLNKVWLIGLAIFEDLLRIAGVVAGFFIIYGGVRYITSQGEPENTKAARSTIINALIGAAIAMVAAVSVSFIGATLGKH